MKDRIKALAKYLELTKSEKSDITDEGYNTFSYGSADYMVLTNDEADDEKYKRDCSFDGRGTMLSGYDGEENESGDYYIYRIS